MTSVALHHELAGPDDAPPLLLGPSLGTTLRMWDPQLPTLSQSRRLVRYDHRGHGSSPVSPEPYDIADLGGDVVALLDRLGIERASYCGLSLGGMVGMWLAANAPERIDRLILVCTSAHLPPASSWTERAAAVHAARSTEAVADAVLGRWLTPPFTRAHPDVVAWVRAMLLNTPPGGYSACCGVIGRLDLRGVLESVASPTLVIAGDQDQSTPPEHGRAIAAAIPGARLEILRSAHLANVECAADVTRLIVNHLDRPEAR